MGNDQTFFDEWLRHLYSLGHRPTGSDTHAALINRVAADLAKLGLDVQRDSHTFERWEITSDRLALTVGGRRIQVASAWPYSGETGPEGVTAKLMFLGGRWRRNWAAAAGRIAVVEVEHRDIPYRLLFDTWSHEPPPRRTVSHPVISAEVSRIDLRKAKACGVLGVIAIWRGLGDPDAAGQYIPFNKPYEGLPAVWVADREGNELIAAARGHASATLVLDAVRMPDVQTDTVWTVCPGTVRPNETVIAVTHTDGVNAVEENGHVGLLAMAREAAAKPHDRTVVFVFATGHLRIPSIAPGRRTQATTTWFQRHPELWSGRKGGKKAVAGIVVEHLGALECAFDPVMTRYRQTGRLEPEILYATTRELAQRVREDWRGATSGPVEPMRPGALIQFGEGEPLLERRIPTVALVTGPEYLAAETDERVVDVAALTRQIESFQRLLNYFATTRTTRGELGIVRPPSLFRKVLARLWALVVLARRPRSVNKLSVRQR